MISETYNLPHKLRIVLLSRSRAATSSHVSSYAIYLSTPSIRCRMAHSIRKTHFSSFFNHLRAHWMALDGISVCSNYSAHHSLFRPSKKKTNESRQCFTRCLSCCNGHRYPFRAHRSRAIRYFPIKVTFYSNEVPKRQQHQGSRSEKGVWGCFGARGHSPSPPTENLGDSPKMMSRGRFA